MNCIIIGAKGFVGSAVAAEAERRGHRLTLVDVDTYDELRGTAGDLLINANGNSKEFLSREGPALDF